ncbi:beta-ketoacyl synthase [Micromonospora sp. S4605]|uniref:beta-ketoacyl synthase N-terminal-like domain-containing protein n=1 Tax=Micromonospora sp. S4605 TaxID=1420897 RepID=UPI000D70071D|nr:beta-ketoacyl synthase N-terminal-like domain-containing protein [Micromonospora sp. S4605]PWU53670.1 beta-ketoacyl synthase [Micromonospora sp. S4605]
MTALQVIGWGATSPAGTDHPALVGALDRPPAPVEVAGRYDAPLPTPRAHALLDFDVRAELGRKGTSFFDRRTALTVVTCRRALADAGLQVTDANRHRIGVVLGTTAGSVRSSVDYAVDTFTQDPPYMVNPALFPNTVMNCAAGQSAIWFNLTGVNATLAGGRVAFLSVLRWCANSFRSRQADYLLAGAVEEFTPHTAWLSRHGRDDDLPAGEGGAVFVLRPPGGTHLRGPDAEVLAVTLGFSPRGRERAEALAGCLRGALDRCGVDGGQVRMAAIGGADDAAARAAGWRAVESALGHSRARRIAVDEAMGDNPTAGGALELATVLAAHRQDPRLDGQLSVLVAQNREGAVGAAVVRGWGRGTDRG